MKRFLIAILTMGIAIACCSCAEKSKITAKDPQDTSSVNDDKSSSDKLALRLEKAEPLEVPEKIISKQYPTVENLDDYLALVACAVQGTVKEIQEYKRTEYRTDTNEITDSYYYSVVTLEVNKNYGEHKMKYCYVDTIRFRYRQNTHHMLQNLPMLKVGDSCIAFLTDNKNFPSKLKANDYSHYFVLNPEIGLCIESDKGYDASSFMRLSGNTKTYYSLYELEECIVENKDKMKNLLFLPYLNAD